jgi:hypothetical protein
MTGNVWEWCGLVQHAVSPRGPSNQPDRPHGRHSASIARRLLPVPLLLLSAVPHVGADGQHARLLLGQHRIPGGSLIWLAEDRRQLVGLLRCARSAAAVSLRQLRQARDCRLALRVVVGRELGE